MAVNLGDVITDGTVEWTVRDLRGGTDGNPVGTILAFAGNGAIPEGYLLCDGSAVSRTLYADLFAVIGTTYGAGDGSTTFNIPNMSGGRMLQGDVANNIGMYIEPGLPNIIGYIMESLAAGNQGTLGTFGAITLGQTGISGMGNNASYKWVSLSFDAANFNSIYGASNTVQPRALNVPFIIKY